MHRLKKDILTLSTDPRLLRIRDFISLPLIIAFSSPSSSSALNSTSSHAQSIQQKKLLLARSGVQSSVQGSVQGCVRGSVSMTWKKPVQPVLSVSVGKENQNMITGRGTCTDGTVNENKNGHNNGNNNGDKNGNKNGNKNENESAESELLRQGSRDLLALLIARILHGLPSKLLPAAAWRELSGSWSQYRHYTFESVLTMTTNTLTSTSIST